MIMPPIPSSPEQFIELLKIESNFERYGMINGSNFFYSPVRANGSFHAVFVNSYVLQKTKLMEQISINIDATFSIVPRIFYQLLVVLVQWKERE